METLWVEGQITALSRIHCGAKEKTGNSQLMHREDYMMSDGKVESIPLLPGNSIRGMLRRLLLQDFFEQAGYTPKTPKLYYTRSGGALEEVGAQESGVLNLALRRDVRMHLHPLSLLGTAMGNQAFTGKLCISDASLICKELNDFLPIKSDVSYRRFVTWSFFTRHAEREIPETVEQNMQKQEPTIQMKVEVECLMAGTKFFHEFALEDTTELEKSCFARLIELWKQRPFIGGKSSVGYGKIRFDYPQMAWTSEKYLSWIAENKPEITAVLQKLDQKQKNNSTDKAKTEEENE
jgi:CRISPR/Cas system CSM-associated protein Csm3 (group 7 of RAMP superfamily)